MLEHMKDIFERFRGKAIWYATKLICSRIKQGPINLGKIFLYFSAPPTLVMDVTFKKTLSTS